MPRGKRARGKVRQENMENHRYNKYILSELHTTMKVLEAIKSYMPVPEMMDSDIHGWKHLMHMMIYASCLCQYSRFSLDVVYWAIMFHDAGRYSDRKEGKHPLMGAYVFNKAFEKVDIDMKKQIGGIIGRHSLTDGSLTTEEAVVRTCDRLDLWRVEGFSGLDSELMEAPGWQKVEKVAQTLRGDRPHEIETLGFFKDRN